ncbi:hypothetical protein XANCAGTX0491_002426 [Xanthoria calcicola]
MLQPTMLLSTKGASLDVLLNNLAKPVHPRTDKGALALEKLARDTKGALALEKLARDTKGALALEKLARDTKGALALEKLARDTKLAARRPNMEISVAKAASMMDATSKSCSK